MFFQIPHASVLKESVIDYFVTEIQALNDTIGFSRSAILCIYLLDSFSV